MGPEGRPRVLQDRLAPSRDFSPYIFATLAALILAACHEGAPAGGTLAVQVDTVGGTVRVRSAGQPPQWRLERVYALGSLEEGPTGFGRITSILADDDGRLYVADPEAHEIRIFAADGGFLRAIGRKGRGPGEIQNLYSIAWLGGALAVLDPGNTRIGLFAPTGEWLGSRRVQAITGDTRLIRLYAAGDQELFEWGVRRGDRGLQGVFVRHRPDGVGDTLPRPPRDPRAADHGVTCFGGEGGLGFFTTAFSPQALATAAPGGARVSVWTAEYRVAFLGPEGDTVRLVEREHAPLPLTDEDWAEQTARFRRFRDRWTGASCQPAEPARPAAKPALRAIFFDPRGRMWVEVYDASGFVFEVFDPDGRLVGALRAPERDDRVEPYVRGERLYFVATDSLGVQYVHAYRIEARE